MIAITHSPISVEEVIEATKTPGSGCVATYVGLIRNASHGKPVLSVEYTDVDGRGALGLQGIVGEARQQWVLEDMSMVHRVGRLAVGDINLVVAVAAAHRDEAIAACRFAVDCFKESMPTRKIETYLDGSTYSEYH